MCVYVLCVSFVCLLCVCVRVCLVFPLDQGGGG